MANTTKTDKKFGVVHTSPTKLITNAASLEDGKLYFAAGDASGLVKQGIYGVVGVTTDGSIDIDGSGNGKQLAMFGTGAIADGTGYGLSQYNFDSDASTKLKNLYDASSNYLKIEDASYFRTVKVDNTSIVADSSKDTLEFVAGSNIMITPDASNDKIIISATDTVYTGNDPISVNGLTISHADSSVTAGRYGDTSSMRTLEFGGKFKVVDVSVNAFGHVTNAASYELTLPSKPATAGVADEAKKTTGTLTFKVNGADTSTFNGSADTFIDISAGTNISISEASDGVIKIDTSGVPTTEEMDNAINTALSSALQYKGTVKDGSVLPISGNKTGDVYVASGAYTTSQNNILYKCETGDLFIYNGSYFDIVNGENQVSNNNASISANGTEHNVTIATVDGTDITVKVPAAYYTHPVADTPTQSLGNASKTTTVVIGAETKIATVYDVSFDASGHYKGKVARDISINITSNNTDEKVKANTSTGKFYLIGQEDATSGTTETTYKNASVYVDGSALYSEGKKVLTGYTEQYTGTVKWVYPGTGLTNGTADSSITSTGTLNLKIATSDEIGGVKPGTTVANSKIYGVQVNASTGEMTVNVPWTDNTDEKVKDASGTGKSFILGHAAQGTTTTATTNASVYMESGKMYATSGLVESNNAALVTGGAVYTAVEAATIYWETL